MSIIAWIVIGALALFSIIPIKSAGEKESIRTFGFVLIFLAVLIFILWFLCIALPTVFVDMVFSIF